MNLPELTILPEEIFNQELKATELKIYGRKLGDPVFLINFDDINSITLEKSPEQAKVLWGAMILCMRLMVKRMFFHLKKGLNL